MTNAKQITFIVTQDCQLACKYCYLVGKNSSHKMSFETAKRVVDMMLDGEFKEDSVVWDFMGGEPLLEIDLLNEVCSYIEKRLLSTNHKWKNAYTFNITTNGINYNTQKVQEYIAKFRCHLNISITIDGTKSKHDTNRISKNGIGSYDIVVDSVRTWTQQFPEVGTKVTISSEDIPYVRESVLHLFDIGIKNVYMNCVFEDVWNPGDDFLLEEQLIQLADTLIQEDRYIGHSCSIFDKNIGRPLPVEKDNTNWCGAGKMLAVDSMGKFYPCNRFAKYSLRSKDPIVIGDIDNGIDKNLLRPFEALNRKVQCSQKCIECEIATGCAWCQAENYDSAQTDTIFQRSTAICKMHHARVRANNYYWNKLSIKKAKGKC